jgi:hypothetical protein
MRFQVLTATNVKIVLFWDIALCSLVDTERRFRAPHCLQHQELNTVLMEVVRFFDVASMVSMLATGPKVRGFKPGRGDGFLWTIKIRCTPSFGGEVNPSAQRRKI